MALGKSSLTVPLNSINSSLAILPNNYLTNGPLFDEETKKLRKSKKNLFNELFFNSDSIKGYGFIERDDKEKDAFVHASAVKAAGMRYLNEGDKLEFTLEDGPKGPSAVNLKKID